MPSEKVYEWIRVQQNCFTVLISDTQRAVILILGMIMKSWANY